MTGLGILLLIVVFIAVVWPMIYRWLRRRAMERLEDYIRASTGMPPRDKKRGRGKQKGTSGAYEKGRTRNPFEERRRNRGPIIPKEYAEDVEFVEIKEFSSTERRKVSETGEIHFESQISDAEYTEIKKNRD